jgi:beta-phosphoglucomutase
MLPEAVIFEFDGVFADTENIHIAAWERTLDALGIEASAKTCSWSLSMADEVFLLMILRSCKIKGGNIEGWARRKQELVMRMMADSPRIFPGAVELAQRLYQRGVRMAMVSTSMRPQIKLVLKAVGLVKAFPIIVSKESLEWVKPLPDAFQIARKRLKIPAEATIALEDSEMGYRAARAARLTCVAVGHREPVKNWSLHPYPYLESLEDVDRAIALLETHGRRR